MPFVLPASRVSVKICGITRESDALAAIDAGADFLGFNTWTGTPRHIDLAANAAWIAALPPSAARVALLVGAGIDEARSVAAFPFIDALQLHGDETAAECAAIAALGKPIIKAIRARDDASYAEADAYSTPHLLLDAHVPGAMGGTGAKLDTSLVQRFRKRHPQLTLWLAGGLKPDNVTEAIRATRPAVVDVSSGVESEPARKDFAKMRDFVCAAREA